jgi:hypothetical protein
MVQQALDFFVSINLCKENPEAKLLPNGSESCFSIDEHLSRVHYRVHHLLSIEASSPIDNEALGFVRKELLAQWKMTTDFVCRNLSDAGVSIDEEINRHDRCVSPSDFGFHNAILHRDGFLRFVDFEYAGWDDPAKLVCDFFCQPAVPVPFCYFDVFARTVAAGLSDPERHIRRMAILFPVYQIKWCCILLNDFLCVDSSRRRFAGSAMDQEEQKVRQLHKARYALNSVIR